MSWSKDYKKSIDCGNPKGFSQKAHCAARKKRQRGESTKSMSPFNEEVSGVKFPKFGHKAPHLKGKQQHQLDPNLDLKQLVHHATVQYVDRDADGDIDVYDNPKKGIPDENVSSTTKAQEYSTKLIKKQKGEMLHTKRGSAFEETEVKYCKLCRKMESRSECSYGPSMWDKYSVAKVHPANEAKDHEYSMARSELSTIVNGAKRLQKKMKKGEGEIEAWVQSKITKAADYIDTAADYVDSGEMNKEEVEILEGKRDGKSAKDKDYSLRDWFKGGGWVQAGGKYDGKPCAKQPGQKTKPFCRDADDRAAMSKDEREKRAKKKRKEDPNPNRKGKAKIVREETDKSIGVKTDKPHKTLQQMIDRQKLGGKVYIPPSELKSASIMNLGAQYEPEGEQLDELWGKVAIAAGAAALPYLMKKFGKPAADKEINKHRSTQQGDYEVKGGLGAYAARARTGGMTPEMQKQLNQSYEPESQMVEEKDACYKKVKARYDVWPSAYASGALVKCRKVGAANWGNKTKKESYEYSNWREELSEDWQKVNKQDKTDGMSPAAVKAYRRENPGSKLTTAVTEKDPGPGRSKRRKSFCARSKGQQDMHNIDCSKTPDKAICKARRRWRC